MQWGQAELSKWRFNIRRGQQVWQTLLGDWHNFPSQTPFFLLFFIKGNRALDVPIITFPGQHALSRTALGISWEGFCCPHGDEQVQEHTFCSSPFLNADIAPGTKAVTLRPRKNGQENHRAVGAGITDPTRTMPSTTGFEPLPSPQNHSCYLCSMTGEVWSFETRKFLRYLNFQLCANR